MKLLVQLLLIGMYSIDVNLLKLRTHGYPKK